MPELEQVQEPDAAYDAGVLAGWLQAATLPGADTSALWERVERVCAGSKDLALAQPLLLMR
jgi:hypothetical protein